MNTGGNYNNSYALLLIVTGLLIRCLIGRRRFYRRNVAGLQQFPSYRRAICTTILETLLSVIASLFLLAGMLWLALAVLNHLFKS
ncbi:hypothetical protein MTO98_30670 [Mucilaginibacter sp. SMC90]|uniref:hypothetical protein n=1 Tax=Mucilaginibacter sp. SMC90 TaxID=2929803 RepID=UPI001FB3CF1A|nr:hypothetical protein [Mucilaginibacter sp. SMC90]UOE48766.1 hypothetical protein MTO98_30670 [Mucilaginibacter sp. SMC90]